MHVIMSTNNDSVVDLLKKQGWYDEFMQGLTLGRQQAGDHSYYWALACADHIREGTVYLFKGYAQHPKPEDNGYLVWIFHFDPAHWEELAGTVDLVREMANSSESPEFEEKRLDFKIRGGITRDKTKNDLN